MKYIFWLVTLCSVCFADPCEEWFAKSKLQKDDQCAAKCVLLPTGLDSFGCPAFCAELCAKPGLLDKTLSKLVYYPGLTRTEKELIQKYPKDAITVYLQKEKAEWASLRKFGYDAEDDESDAYRHFVWAALLSSELGAELAKQFLDAHEANDFGNDSERAMDLANNRAGLLAAEQLKRNGKLSHENILLEAEGALNDKTLVVLKPRKLKK